MCVGNEDGEEGFRQVKCQSEDAITESVRDLCKEFEKHPQVNVHGHLRHFPHERHWTISVHPVVNNFRSVIVTSSLLTMNLCGYSFTCYLENCFSQIYGALEGLQYGSCKFSGGGHAP